MRWQDLCYIVYTATAFHYIILKQKCIYKLKAFVLFVYATPCKDLVTQFSWDFDRMSQAGLKVMSSCGRLPPNNRCAESSFILHAINTELILNVFYYYLKAYDSI